MKSSCVQVSWSGLIGRPPPAPPNSEETGPPFRSFEQRRGIGLAVRLPTRGRTTVSLRRRPRARLPVAEYRQHNQRRFPGDHPRDDRPANEQVSRQAEEKTREPARERHPHQGAARGNEKLCDDSRKQRGRHGTNPLQNLGVRRKASREKDSQEPPDFARQEADEDHDHVWPERSRDMLHHRAARRRPIRWATVPPTRPATRRSNSF